MALHLNHLVFPLNKGSGSKREFYAVLKLLSHFEINAGSNLKSNRFCEKYFAAGNFELTESLVRLLYS